MVRGKRIMPNSIVNSYDLGDGIDEITPVLNKGPLLRQNKP